eukprot:Hpha_TRINITY_DN15322_c2_g19::TRINITY_DN15322_c2_g19_i1::g.91595::m.91595
MWGGETFSPTDDMVAKKTKKKEKKQKKKEKEEKREAKRQRIEAAINAHKAQEASSFVVFNTSKDGRVEISAGVQTKKGKKKDMGAAAKTQHLVAVQGQGPRWGGNNAPSEHTAIGKAIAATAQTFQCGACGFLFRAYWGSSVDCSNCGGNIDIPYTRDQAMEVSKQTTQGCAKTTSNREAWEKLKQAAEPNPDAPLQITGGPGEEGKDGKKADPKKQLRVDKDAASRAVHHALGPLSKVDARTGDLVQTVAGHPWVTAMRFARVNMGQLDLEDRHVILLMGQSNMIGRDRNMPLEVRNPLDGPCWSVDENGRFIKGCAEPMCPPDGRWVGCSPGRAFAERVFQHLGTDHGVVIVPCAVSATSLAQWQRGQMLYSVSVSRARAAAKAAGGRIAGVLWHQGEDDGCAKVTADRYHELMMNFIADLRNDLHDTLPIVMGQLGPFLDEESLMPVHRHMDVINLAIRNIGQMPGCAAVPGSEHCMADRLHFNAEGQQEMGFRYADAWCMLYAKQQLSQKRIGPDRKAYSKEAWAKKFGDFKDWAWAEIAPEDYALDAEDSDSDDSSMSLADAAMPGAKGDGTISEECQAHLDKLKELSEIVIQGLDPAEQQEQQEDPLGLGLPGMDGPEAFGLGSAPQGDGSAFGLGGGDANPPAGQLALRAPSREPSQVRERAPSVCAPGDSDSETDSSGVGA